MSNPDLTGRRLGEYVLHEAIGQGGGGLVYKSRQPTLDRELVVKVLHNAKHQHSNAKERFLREAQLASRLRHPYATHIYAFGVELDGTRWIAMELAQGTTFDRWLRQHGPMSLETFVPFFERVAEVVHAAHKLGIVHRDIKPSNVMVAEDDAGVLVPKLLDFGIAKAAYDPPPRLADGSLGENVPKRPVSPATGKEVPPDHDEDEYEYDDFDYEAHERERAAITRAALEQERAEAEAGGAPLAVGPFGAAAFGLVPISAAPRALAPPATAPPVPPERVTRTDPEAYKVGYTPPGAPMGSAPYMSPEQFGDASSVGPAADIYSLGVFAHLALFGELPPPQTPKRAANPTALERIFTRALAWLPADRPATALLLASEFRTALEASEREQLRASTKQWKAGDRAPGLLWGVDMLARYEQWTRTTTWRPLDEDEVSFIKQSHRRGRRSRWHRRLMIGLAATVVLGTLGGLQLYTSMKARLAQDQVVQLEVEQGRQALHYNSIAEAKVHLANAYRLGDHSYPTTFMLARALQSDRAQLARLPAHGGRMWSGRFSPRGDTVVTADDEAAQLWDARTYKVRFTFAHPATVYDAVFSGDGKTLYTACDDGAIRAWDTSTGASLGSLQSVGKPVHYYRLALSPDEHVMAAIDLTGATTTIWDLSSGGRLATIANGEAGFPSIAFTADGDWFVSTGGVDVLVFDTKTWKNVRSFPKGMRFGVDPTGPRIATGSSEGDVVVSNVSSGSELLRLSASKNSIDQVAFSRDGKHLAAIEKGETQIWTVSTGEVQARLSTRPSTATSLEFSAKSDLLLSAFSDGVVVVMDGTTGEARSVFAPNDEFLRAAFAPDGDHFITTALTGTARVWGAAQSYARWGADPRGPECHYDIPSDQRFLSLACPGRPTRIWDAQEGRLVTELPSIVDLHDDWISVLSAVSVTGERAAIVRGHDVSLYELPGSRLLRTVHHAADVNVVAFTPDTQELVSADMEGTILLTRDGQDPVALPQATAGIDALGILRDRIVAASADRQLFMYDRASHKLLAQRTTSNRIATLRFSSDEARMAAVPSRRNVPVAPELWDLHDVRLIGGLQGPRDMLFSVWFPNDKHELLTTSFDKTIKKWDADTGRLLQSYRGSPSILADATVTADGKAVVGLGLDGMLRFWESDTGRQLWSTRTIRSSALEVRRYRGDLITIGANGEISGWRFPDAEPVIKEVLDLAVSCSNETHPSNPTTCRSP